METRAGAVDAEQPLGAYELQRQQGRAPRSITFSPKVTLRVSFASGSAASAVSGLARLADLGLGGGLLGLSAATLVEARKQTRLLLALQAGMQTVQEDLTRLLARAERMDIGVAELNLREVLRSALRSATTGEVLDLEVLRDQVVVGLRRFEAALSPELGPGTHARLQLSPDVRQMLEAIFDLLWAARVHALTEHNLACQGDPAFVRNHDTSTQLFRERALLASVLKDMKISMMDVANQVSNLLRDNKGFWGSSGEMRGQVRNLLNEARAQAHNQQEESAQAAALWAQASSLGITANLSGRQLTSRLEAYLAAWSASADAAVVWRLREELRLHSSAAYWAELRADGGSSVGVLQLLPPPSTSKA